MTDQIEEQDVELDENEEIVDEAHDPKNAPQHSAAAVDKAGDAVKGQAPARTGDKRNSEPMPKTKAGMLSAIYTKMGGMPKQDIASAYKNMFGEDIDTDEEALAEAPEVDVKSELNTLVENEATLSEEFKEKTAILFETALASKIAEEIDRIESEYEERFTEEVETMNESMVEKIDGYLNYVVENWMEENKLAIQSGLRTEIAEDFMAGLKTLFVESYVEVPESKVDLVDDLAEQVEELEEEINKITKRAMTQAEELEVLQRERVIAEAAWDLADTQAEKLTSMVEKIDFEDAESFAKKVSTVKESLFAKATNNEELEEESTSDDDTFEVSSTMEGYLTALKRLK